MLDGDTGKVSLRRENPGLSFLTRGYRIHLSWTVIHEKCPLEEKALDEAFWPEVTEFSCAGRWYTKSVPWKRKPWIKLSDPRLQNSFELDGDTRKVSLGRESPGWSFLTRGYRIHLSWTVIHEKCPLEEKALDEAFWPEVTEFSCAGRWYTKSVSGKRKPRIKLSDPRLQNSLNSRYWLNPWGFFTDP